MLHLVNPSLETRNRKHATRASSYTVNYSFCEENVKFGFVVLVSTRMMLLRSAALRGGCNVYWRCIIVQLFPNQATPALSLVSSAAVQCTSIQ